MWLLTRKLKSKNPGKRLAALEKIVARDTTKAIPHLLSALEDPESEIRKFAANSLGTLRVSSAVGPLCKKLSDLDPEVRMAAVVSLQALGDKLAIPALIQSLADGHDGVQSCAASALQALGWAPADNWQRALLAVGLGKFEEATRYQSAAIEPLLTVLRTGSPHKRLEAVDALSKITDAKVAPPLLTTLQDDEPGVRARAANILGKARDARFVEPLITALQDPAGVVREAAVEALNKLGDNRALKPLVERLQDSSEDVRKMAAEGLGNLRNAAAVEPLSTVLRDTDKEVRQTAAMALGNIGDPRAVEHLILSLADKEDSVRQTAEFALRKIDPDWEKSDDAREALPSVESALRNEHYKVREAAAALLKRLPARVVATPRPGVPVSTEPVRTKSKATQAITEERKEATRILAKALADLDPDLRLAAAEALGRIGSNPSFVINPLTRNLLDADPRVRRSAAKALDSLQWTPSAAVQSAHYYIASRAWPQLSTLGPAAVEPLIGVLEDKDWGTRRHAAEILGQIKDKRSVRSLASCLADPNRSVRQTAATSLVAMEPLDLDDTQLKLLEEALRG